jgi:hypothetical protein
MKPQRAQREEMGKPLRDNFSRISLRPLSEDFDITLPSGEKDKMVTAGEART